MADLNPAQHDAVNTLAGPLLVLAGAGTGKTRVVTFRVANLIKHGTRPDRILAVTFTNKASLEMQERISHQLKLPKRVRRGQPAPLRPQIGTFHSHCVQILKRHASVLGYPEKFTIYDRSDAESVARTVLREIRVHEDMLAPPDFLNIVSRWKNAGVRPERAESEAVNDKEHVAASAFKRYQRALKLQAAFDFDDLLVCAEQLLTENEAVRRVEAGRYDHVLVDEYQDTNGTQYKIIKTLAQDHRNLCVVGDDDQSIYGWRGAEVRHILNFKNDWPEAKVVRLEENYRSTDAILTMANRLIAFNQHRHGKILRPARRNGSPPRVLQFPGENEEAKGVVEEISQRIQRDRGVAPGDFAILFRTNEQPRPFELELRRLNVPYKITGTQSFFDRKEVRDILAYLRWIDQPNDELALLRVINVPPRGMGASSVDKLLKQAVSSSKSIWQIMHDTAFVATLSPGAQRGVASLIALNRKFEKLFSSGSGEVGESIQGIVEPIVFRESNSLPSLVDEVTQDSDSGDNELADSVEKADDAIAITSGQDASVNMLSDSENTAQEDVVYGEGASLDGDAVEGSEEVAIDTMLETEASGDEEFEPDEESGCMTDAVHHLIEHLKYRQEIERLYTDADEAVMRIGSLEAVLNAVAQYEQDATEPNLGDFLASVTLSGREYGSSKDKNAGVNAVSLMTYHSAKGLEFPIVYMVGMEEGVLPHRRSITEEGDSVDEERRLCYVGVTRAQDELTLTLPLSRFKWGKPRPTYPSRFLYELTDQADNPNRAKAIKAAADEARKASRTAR